MCGGGSCSNKKKKCKKCVKEKMLSLIQSKSVRKPSKKKVLTCFLAARKGGVNVLGKYVH